MHSLLDAGVIDDDHHARLPGATRQGNAHFEDRQDLKLIEATLFENGAAILRYEVKK